MKEVGGQKSQKLVNVVCECPTNVELLTNPAIVNILKESLLAHKQMIPQVPGRQGHNIIMVALCLFSINSIMNEI